MNDSVWADSVSLQRSETLSDRVTDEILSMISANKLKPGDRLPAEREIGERFGVSRTVVREALRSLAAKGVVDVRSGSGAKIARVGSDKASEAMRLFVETSRSDDPSIDGGVTYEQISDVREMIETRVARIASTSASESAIAKLQRVHDEFVASNGDPEKTSRLDVAFHRAIAESTGNPLYLVMLDSIDSTLLEIRRLTLALPNRFDRGVQEHGKILQHIVAHEPALAEQAMREHLAESRKLWESMSRDAAG